jgi:hypothetical protein
MRSSKDKETSAVVTKKPWLAPVATSEKVRDITASHPAHRTTADGFCSS